MIHGGRERNVPGRKPPALAQQHLAAGKIERLAADVLSRLRRAFDEDDIAAALGLFLHDDGIGPGRHHSAGEDAGGLAGADAAGKRPSGRDLADQFQFGTAAGHVRGADRITVHR